MDQPICSPGMSYGSPPMGEPQYHEMQPAHFQHQHNGHQRQPPHLQQMSTEFRVAEWQRPYDSGVHSLQHSQAPSVMSMPGSRMSVVSIPDTADLTDQQRQKFENIPLSFDACQPEAASAAIPDLINLINDEDETVAVRALGFIKLTAKRDSETKFQQPIINQPDAVKAIVELLHNRQESTDLVRNALGALFFISSRNLGVQLVFHANHQLNGLMVRKLIDFIKIPNTQLQKLAHPLLHTLLSDTKGSAPNVKLANECGALEALNYCLYHEVNEKLLAIIVQSINHLVVRNPEQIRNFFALRGPERLIYILYNFQYEGLLVGATKLLNKLTAHADELGQLNAPHAVCRGISHASHRLVELSLECLRNLSHLRSMQHQQQILESVKQLLGSQKPKHVQYCLDILINMCAESKANKEALCGGSPIVAYLMNQILRMPFDAFEDLQETALRLLRILCHDHEGVELVQSQVAGHLVSLYAMLATMRPKLIWRTLQLINRLEHHLPTFANCQQRSPEGTQGFASIIVRILYIACGNLGNDLGGSVKVVDILQSAVIVLNLFCRNASLREQVAGQLMLPNNMSIGQVQVYLPIFVLQQSYPGKDQIIKQQALSIVAATVGHPQVAAMFRNDPMYMNGLHQISRLPDYAAIAQQALKTLQEGVQQPYPPLRCAPVPTGAPDRRFPPQRPSSPALMEADLPEDLASIENPFVNVFCPTSVPQNTPPFSPHQQRYDQLPPMNYPDPYSYPGPYGPGPPPTYQYPPSQPPHYPNQPPYPQQQDPFYEHYPGGEYRYPPG